MKFSVITPMYNTYSLMDCYFKSLESQTYKNFEIIIVDDCSTDDSYERLKSLVQDSTLRIKVLQSPQNMGPGYARNMGMDTAEGEWITFVDNDDWVEFNWLETINQVIDRNDVDCIIYDYYKKGESGRKVMHSMIDGDEGVVAKSKCIACITNHTIGKFYKLSNCKNHKVRFPHTRRCEDIAFTCLAIDASHSIYYLKKPLYYYFQRQDSLSNNLCLGESDMIQAFSVLQGKLGSKYPQEIAEKSVRDLLYGGVLLLCKSKKSTKEIRCYINNYENKHPKWYEAVSISYLQWPKRIFLKLIRYRFISGIRLLSWLHGKMVK